MPLRRSVPQDENNDIQVNEKHMYPEANQVEVADIFDENLQAMQVTSEQEKNWLRSNPKMRHRRFSEI